MTYAFDEYHVVFSQVELPAIAVGCVVALATWSANALNVRTVTVPVVDVVLETANCPFS